MKLRNEEQQRKGKVRDVASHDGSCDGEGCHAETCEASTLAGFGQYSRKPLNQGSRCTRVNHSHIRRH
jgi:hypothetical protein